MTRWEMLGFFALCLWSSAGWLVDDALGVPGASTSREGFRFLLVGVVGFVTHRLSVRGKAPPISRCVLVGAGSLGLLGVPFLLLAGVEGHVASTSVVVLFALTPIVLAVLGEEMRLLPYGLLGVAGLMGLLPLRIPTGVAGVLGVGLVLVAMLSTAGCMAWLHRLLSGFPLGLALGVAGMGNGLLLLAAAVPEVDRWSVRAAGMESVRCVLVDLPKTILLIWMTKAVAPQRLSARYLVAPMLTVMEGLALLHPRFDTRTLGGLMLLGIGAYRIMFPESQQQETPLNLS